MMAEAAQKYGMLVRDTTGSANVFAVEQPHAGEANPVSALLGGKYPSQALAAFPWQALQVLDAPSCTGGGCEIASRAVVDVDSMSPTVGREVSLDTSRSSLDQPRAHARLLGGGYLGRPRRLGFRRRRELRNGPRKRRAGDVHADLDRPTHGCGRDHYATARSPPG